MRVNADLCTGCGLCARQCPARAITVVARKATIDESQCFECGVCERSGVCRSGAFEAPAELPWPRSVRSILSNPLTEFKETGVTGRGTEEMKTNDVTGRFPAGILGVAIDVGRPNAGTTMRAIGKITAAVAQAGVDFEPKNPVTFLMEDVPAGRLRPDVLDERVMSAVIEFTVDESGLARVLDAIRGVAGQVDTVFSVGIISRVRDDWSIPVLAELERLGHPARAESKVNVGLGRRC